MQAGDKNEVYDRITILHAAEWALRGGIKMAIFHKTLQYHEDTTEKRDISQETALKEYENDERVRVYDESHQFIAIYCYCRKDDLFKIVKMFFNEKK